MIIGGCHHKHYAGLPYYCEEIRSNKSSTGILKVKRIDYEVEFQRLYIALRHLEGGSW